MLKIPTADDTAPPLLAPLRRTSPEEPQEARKDRRAVKKRRKSKKGAGSHSWESDTSSPRRAEGIRMRWFLIGGAALLALSITGVMIAMKNRSNHSESAGQLDLPVNPHGTLQNRTDRPVLTARSEVAFLAEAKKLAHQFLTATTIDQLLPLVRNPDLVAPKMRLFYQNENLKAEGISQFNTKEMPQMVNGFRSITILTGDFDERTMVYSDSAGAMKVDWESWVGWSDMSWKDFMTTKPQDAKTFRVNLSAVDYYNFDFKDEDRWQSFRLESPDREYAVYGYVERFSDLAKAIVPNPDEKFLALTLSLKFPSNASSNQVVIERLVNTGWLEPEENK